MRKITLLFTIIGVSALCFGQAPVNSKITIKLFEQTHLLKGDGQVFWSEDFDWENPDDIKEGHSLRDGSF